MNPSEAHGLVAPEPQVPAESLPRLFWRFLRFGLLAWGGPVAQIAMVRQELVEEEKWGVGRPSAQQGSVRGILGSGHGSG